MILLNLLYGLCLGVVLLAIYLIYGWPIDWLLIISVSIAWSVFHILYDFAAHYLVKFFNRNAVYRG